MISDEIFMLGAFFMTVITGCAIAFIVIGILVKKYCTGGEEEW